MGDRLGHLMSQLEALTWLRFGVWLVIGLVIYATYGYRHSKLRNA
jgi:APA family basic amino acid/polyamine antiporter